MLDGSVAMFNRILRDEGVRGFYKGLSASYFGMMGWHDTVDAV